MLGKRKVSYFTFWAVFCSLVSLAQSHASDLVSIRFNQGVVVCELDTLPKDIAVSSKANCTDSKWGSVDPQRRLLLVQVDIAIPDAVVDSVKPLGLFLSGKSASIAYINGKRVGKNGQPAADMTEVPGAMDAVFFVPTDVLKRGENRISLILSGQHSLIRLGNPLHFFRIGEYDSPRAAIQSFGEIGLLLMGMFLLGAIYFSGLWFYHRERLAFALFAVMCVIAACQLGAEIYRGFASYIYPIHDFRLVIVTTCATAFGLCLLAYTTMISRSKHGRWIFIVSALLTLFLVYSAPGFDVKTLLGTVIPLFCGLLLTCLQALKLKRFDLVQWALSQAIFLLTSWLATALFHEFLYYLLIALLLAFLLYQQAKDMALQQKQQREDQKSIAKLEYQLAQIAALKESTKLAISIGGKTEMIDSKTITHCKASGDYVELYLADGSERLYSSSLKVIESKLPDTFLRVHRSYLVNLSFVASLQSATGTSNARLQLTNNAFVDVSRRLLPSVRATITST